MTFFFRYVSDNQIRDEPGQERYVGVPSLFLFLALSLCAVVDIRTKHTILLIFNALARKTCTFYEAAFLSELQQWNYIVLRAGEAENVAGWLAGYG